MVEAMGVVMADFGTSYLDFTREPWREHVHVRKKL